MEGSLELGGYGQKGIAHRDVPTWRRHLGSLPRQVKSRRGTFNNLQQLFVHRAGGVRGFSQLPHPQTSPALPGHNPAEH